MPGSLPYVRISPPNESRVYVLSDQPSGHLAPATTLAAAASDKSQDLSDGWQVQLAAAAQPVPMAHLASWTELPNARFFSGVAVYTRRLTIGKVAGQMLLDFGKGTPTTDNRPPTAPGIHALLDPPIREVAIVSVNGKRVGSIWHPPYRIDISGFVHPGENTLEVRVANTAMNEMAGQPRRDYKELTAKYGERFVMQDMDKIEALPSGLLGPIRLITQPKGIPPRRLTR